MIGRRAEISMSAEPRRKFVPENVLTLLDPSPVATPARIPIYILMEPVNLVVLLDLPWSKESVSNPVRTGILG